MGRLDWSIWKIHSKSWCRNHRNISCRTHLRAFLKTEIKDSTSSLVPLRGCSNVIPLSLCSFLLISKLVRLARRAITVSRVKPCNLLVFILLVTSTELKSHFPLEFLYPSIQSKSIQSNISWQYCVLEASSSAMCQFLITLATHFSAL